VPGGVYLPAPDRQPLGVPERPEAGGVRRRRRGRGEEIAVRYHIVGIAGAGMSAIAHILLDQGHEVQGSDAQRGPLAAALERRGALVLQGHAAEHVAGADALVATSAVRDDHVELRAARERGIPVLRRADLWREWSQQREVVAVAGTHGKTTTTALIALALSRAGV